MLRVENVNHNFGELPVLKDINFSVEENEIVALMGPSGCGKTTLLNIISGLEKNYTGNVFGTENPIAFVFQDDRLLPWRTVWQNISIVNDRKDDLAIRQLIKDVGLEGFENYKPNQLSGGMKKRCSIARAFYYDSEILLMDEPFQGLDYFLRQEMFNMLFQVWNAHKQTVLFVTHEIDDAFIVANRIIIFSDRPSTIIKEVELPPLENRKTQTDKLDEIRKEVIALISDSIEA